MTTLDRLKSAILAHPDNQDLKLVASGWQEARKRYSEQKTAANRREWRAAEKDLVEMLDGLPVALASATAARAWPDVLENVNQVHEYLVDQGYKVRSRQTIYNHVKKYALIRRQDGRFDRSVVDSYARAVRLEREQGLTPEQAARPAISTPRDGSPEARALMDVKRDREEEMLLKARMENRQAMGALVDILIVDREQQELCQAVRMHLSPMIRSTAERVLSILGADPDVAGEIVDLVGGDRANVDALVAWTMARKPELVAFFKPFLKSALDQFARGDWYTQEMREAWATYQRHREDAELDDIRSLINFAGGDPERAGDVLAMYYVRRLD